MRQLLILERMPELTHRRRFLKTVAAAASAVVAPQIVPRSVFDAAAPSNRIHVGQIGCGHLGEIRLVRTWVDANSFPSPGPGWQPQPVPDGFDYDLWLGPAPRAPYHIERCFHRWRYILDYSNGQTANFGCHTNDIAQWALNMDRTTPVEFEDNGSEFPPQGSLFTAATKTAFRAR